jgi:hypothetical protein
MALQFNFKIPILVLILISACCLLSIGYNFKLNKLFEPGDISIWACSTLMIFVGYIFYEMFKNDTCDDLNLPGPQRLGNAFTNAASYSGQQLGPYVPYR